MCSPRRADMHDLPSATARSKAGGTPGVLEDGETLEHLTDKQTKENPKQQWSQPITKG